MKIAKPLLAVFLSMLFVLLTVLIILIFSFSFFTKEKSLEKMLSDVDLVNEVQKIRNSGNISNKSKIASSINEMYILANEYSVSDSVVDDIIDSETTRKIIENYLEKLANYIILENDMPNISADEIYNIFVLNIDNWFNDAGVDISDAQKEKFLNRLKLELPDIEVAVNNVVELIDNNYQNRFFVFHFVFSDQFKCVLVFSLLIVSISLYLLYNNFSFVYISFCLLISGLIIIGFALLFPLLVLYLIKEADLSLLSGLFTNYLSLKIFLNGILLIVISTIILIIYKYKNKRIFD